MMRPYSPPLQAEREAEREDADQQERGGFERTQEITQQHGLSMPARLTIAVERRDPRDGRATSFSSSG